MDSKTSSPHLLVSLTSSVQHTSDTFHEKFNDLLGKLDVLHQEKLTNIKVLQTTTPPHKLLQNKATRYNTSTQTSLPSNASTAFTTSTTSTTLTTPTKPTLTLTTAATAAIARQTEDFNKHITLLQLQLQTATTQRDTLKQQLHAKPTVNNSELVSLQEYQALTLKIKALNIGFQGLNTACTKADETSIGFALSILCSLTRRTTQFQLAKAWRKWENVTTYNHAFTSKEFTVRQSEYDVLNRKYQTLLLQNTSLARRHEKVHQQIQITKSKQQDRESGSIENNEKLRQELRTTTVSCKQLQHALLKEKQNHTATFKKLEQCKKEAHEAKSSSSSFNKAVMTVVVEQPINHDALNQLFHKVELETNSEMIGLQNALDSLSMRFINATKKIKQLQNKKQLLPKQNTTTSSGEPLHRHISVLFLQNAIQSAMHLRLQMKSSFHKWHGATTQKIHQEKTYRLASDVERQKQEMYLLKEKKRSLDLHSEIKKHQELKITNQTTKDMKIELNATKEEMRLLTVKTKKLMERHQQEIHNLRSRVVASQQEFDRRIGMMQRERNKEKQIFAEESNRIRMESQGRESLWRSTAESATGSLEGALNRIGRMGRRR